MPLSLILAASLVALFTVRKRLVKAFAAVFLGICLAGSGFSYQILPSIGKLQLTACFGELIRKTDAGTRLGVSGSLAHWIDELTFETDREPVRLNNQRELAAFLDGPASLVIVPESELNSLPEDLRNNLSVLNKKLVISHALTPGYALKRGGTLTDEEPLVLVLNRKSGTPLLGLLLHAHSVWCSGAWVLGNAK